MTCPAGFMKLKPAEEMASDAFNEAVKVPFVAKFVVFARRTSPVEGQLKIFCLTDDVDTPATFPDEDGFVEVARSADVEVCCYFRLSIFTAREYARAVLGVVILSVCLSDFLSHAWIVTKLNDALQIFLYHTNGQSLCYSDTKSGWSATLHSL